MTSKKNATYFEKVYNNAVELFAYLCEEFKLDPIKDILCHSEVYQLGYGSNHADVMHWFPKHGKTMDTFRSDVKSKLAKSTVPVKPITPKSSKEDIIWAQEQYNKLLPVIPNIIPLKTNGEYDAQTRIAALIYLDMLGWGKGMETSGKCIGMNTIKALASGRKKVINKTPSHNRLGDVFYINSMFRFFLISFSLILILNFCSMPASPINCRHNPRYSTTNLYLVSSFSTGI